MKKKRRVHRLVSVCSFSLMLLCLFGNFMGQVSASPLNFALYFDGNTSSCNALARCPTGSYNGSFTVSAWVKVDDLTRGNEPIVMLSLEEEYKGWRLKHDHGVTKMDFVTPDTSITGGKLLAGVWNHVVFVRNVTANQKFLMYLNGELNNTADGNANNYDNINCIHIGEDPFDVYWFKGYIDEIIGFKRALSASEVSELWNDGKASYAPIDETGIVFWYKFDDTDDNKLRDRSENALHMNINEVTWVSGICPDWFEVGSLGIQPNYDTSLSAVVYSGSALRFNVSAKSVMPSITKIYCGNKGRPSEVFGAMTYSHNSETQILTVIVIHTSSKTITVDWTVSDWVSIGTRCGYIAVSIAGISLIVIVVFALLLRLRIFELKEKKTTAFNVNHFFALSRMVTRDRQASFN